MKSKLFLLILSSIFSVGSFASNFQEEHNSFELSPNLDNDVFLLEMEAEMRQSLKNDINADIDNIMKSIEVDIKNNIETLNQENRNRIKEGL